MPEGLLKAANVIPPAFSSRGDPPKSRSPPHLHAAHTGTAAENFSPTHISTCFALFPHDSRAISSAPKWKTSFLPCLYVRLLWPPPRNIALIALTVFHLSSTPFTSESLYIIQVSGQI